jgi:hypothetical protein
MHECDYNWKTFIEVYLEDYHVGPFHPGLGSFVTCEDLRWEFGRHHSVQTVGVHNALAKAGSPTYRRWHDGSAEVPQRPAAGHGAIWLTYYPTVMVEWYPHVLVVSTLFPRGPRKTLNLVEFFYPEEIAAFEREFVEAQQAAYMETCIEDDEIAERMDAGRQALLLSAATTRSAPTRARWKTACSTSTSGTGALASFLVPWGSVQPACRNLHRRLPARASKTLSSGKNVRWGLSVAMLATTGTMTARLHLDPRQWRGGWHAARYSRAACPPHPAP